ncbi:TetR/AcrR family transcriptional regulator [Streptomyces sp. NBC_01803]|uniref:TetR/AcrR family transcriptional regulator n=1 Tax=Streptomyces sp. NBC_01803 TaxID=2975946 RepID=UPI002DD89FD5|nr:TetR family transcriptional regulator [Streptomyces sp. NBC_01803]WSA45576.1 TetR/AcrR family transcriptional regulator [Streptomyces sp. NBC_01803]
MPRTARLTRDDWAAAALDALAEGGPPAVAVEPVAARLGASKSSFYWLFDNRQALLAAALERWERVQTDEILPWLAALPPAERLRRLVHHAFADTTGRGDLALRLLTESADPLVREVTERVTERRLAVLESAFTALGHPPEAARHYAMAGYSAYLGAAALRHTPSAPADPAAYIDTILRAFGVPAED